MTVPCCGEDGQRDARGCDTSKDSYLLNFRLPSIVDVDVAVG